MLRKRSKRMNISKDEARRLNTDLSHEYQQSGIRSRNSG